MNRPDFADTARKLIDYAYDREQIGTTRDAVERIQQELELAYEKGRLSGIVRPETISKVCNSFKF